MLASLFNFNRLLKKLSSAFLVTRCGFVCRSAGCLTFYGVYLNPAEDTKHEAIDSSASDDFNIE